MTTENAPESMYRNDDGMGLWEHRGKVAAVGVGHSPTSRRWDGRAETSVGARTIRALRRAVEDAGVTPDQIDGLVVVPATTRAPPDSAALSSTSRTSTPRVRQFGGAVS